MILIIASFLIMIANISLITSSLVENIYIKGVLGLLIPSILLFISNEVEHSLKLEKSSKLITLMAMFSFFVTLVGTYFNFLHKLNIDSEFINIGFLSLNKYTIVALIGVIIPLIGYFLNRDILYKKIIVVSSLYLAYFVLNSIYTSCTFNILGMTNTNCTLEYVTLSLVLMLYNLFLDQKYSKTLSIVNLFYTFYILSNVTVGIKLIAPTILITSICIFTFLMRIRKEESKKYDAIPFIGIVLLLLNLIVEFSSNLLILPLGFVIITDMLIIVCDIVKDRKEGLTYKIILDLLTILLLIYSISKSVNIITTVLIVLISSLVSTYALKGDYHEQYILPFKMVLCIIGILVEINNHIYLDPVLIVLIVNVFTTLCSYITKNDLFKKIFACISMITFAYMFSIETIFEFIVLLAMVIFDYVVIFEMDKKSVEFKNIYVISAVLLIIIKLTIFENALLYLLASLVFILGHIFIKEKGLSLISFTAFVISLVCFINRLDISYEINDVLSLVFLFGGAYYLATKTNSFNTNAIKTILIVGLSLGLLSLSTLTSILVTIAINVIIMLVYMKNNNPMFKAGVILTVISLFNLLSQLNEVPTFVYMLLIGLIVVFIIIKSIKKYMNEPQEEQEEAPKEVKVTGKKFCTNCGVEVDKDQKYCTNCGNKLID